MRSFLLLLLCALVLPAQAQKHTPGGTPSRADTLKILAIGNSFTVDGTEYLPALLEAAGLGNVALGRVVRGGTSLENHFDAYTQNRADYSFSQRCGDHWEDVFNPSAITPALRYSDWDIVVTQQVSHLSGRYDTYRPWLDSLTQVFSRECSNPAMQLAWQMTWAYGSASTHAGFPNYGNDQQAMYEATRESVRQLLGEYDIRTLIPSGEAIQRLRRSPLNNPPDDLTRDGFHLDYGAGRYTAACTWFQALIAPWSGQELSGIPFREVSSGKIPVTEENHAVFQEAAREACLHPFE